MNQLPESINKIPAKVLGCLRPGYLTVFLGYGLGMADGGIPTDVPMDFVPLDLRMPNSEFIVILDRINSQIIGVERQGDAPRPQRPGGPPIRRSSLASK